MLFHVPPLETLGRPILVQLLWRQKLTVLTARRQDWTSGFAHGFSRNERPWSERNTTQFEDSGGIIRRAVASPHAFFRNISPLVIPFQSTEIVSPVVT